MISVIVRRLDCTEGQAYTMLIGLVLAVVLAVTGIPPVLRTRPVPARAVASPLSGRDQAAGVPAAVTATPVTQVPLGAAPPSRSVVPIAGTTASPFAPTPTDAATPGRAPLTITTFARVDHPGGPGGLAVARDGTVHVTTDNGTKRGDPGASHVFSFDSSGSQIADHTIADQPSDHANGLTGAAVDPITGEVAVLQPDAPRILGLDMSSGAQRVLAEVPDLPACLISLGANPCQQGAEDRRPFPVAAVYDGGGDLLVADPAQDTVWRLRRGANVPEVWLQSPYFTLGDGPYGLVMKDGALEFTVGTTIDPASPGGGGLYRAAVNGDGTVGALTLVALFPRGDEPGPLAVGSSGIAYVVLRGPGAIAAIAPAGTLEWRIDPPGDGPVPLDAPSALALAPDQLLVTNQGSGTDPSHWTVLAVAVNDGPQP